MGAGPSGGLSLSGNGAGSQSARPAKGLRARSTRISLKREDLSGAFGSTAVIQCGRAQRELATLLRGACRARLLAAGGDSTSRHLARRPEVHHAANVTNTI